MPYDTQPENTPLDDDYTSFFVTGFTVSRCRYAGRSITTIDTARVVAPDGDLVEVSREALLCIAGLDVVESAERWLK